MKSTWENIKANTSHYLSKTSPFLVGAAVGGSLVAATPIILGGIIGVSSAGPISGGWFALHQGAGVLGGSIMAYTQSLIMAGVSTTSIVSGGLVSGGLASGAIASNAITNTSPYVDKDESKVTCPSKNNFRSKL